LSTSFVCIKEAVLTDGLSVESSKTLRKVAPGEVLEVLEPPRKDETCGGIIRVEVTALKDSVRGWVTTAGNMGTAFLEPCTPSAGTEKPADP